MSEIKIENEKLKPIIDDILSWYFNLSTRMQHPTSEDAKYFREHFLKWLEKR